MLTRRHLLALPVLPCRAGAERPNLWDYFLRQLDAADEHRRHQLEAIRTPADFEALRARVRRALLGMMGGLPERAPLRPSCTATLTRGDYAIEKIIFESRPRFYVTANLYRPRSVSVPRPAVIQSCGHYAEGKAAPDYQRACIGLARKGFVVLIFDPLGQGERHMYPRDILKHAPTAEHAMAGKPCYLLGKTLAQFRVWDAIRALDYLESRPEVDRSRIGLLGHSGGGMVALLAAPLDDRFRAVMSCCAVTSFYHKTKALLIADPEQILPGIYPQGIDHPELIAAVAPRAFLIGAARRDYVPLEGTRRTYQEVIRLFARAGIEGRVGITETDDEHKLNQELRQACYGWMMKHLTEESGDPREPEIQIETEADLWCTPAGSVADLPAAQTVFDLNRREAHELASTRPALRMEGVRRLLALPDSPQRPKRIGGRIQSEAGVDLPFTLSAGSRRHDILLVLQGTNSALAADFIEASFSVLSMDLRGRGARMPDKRANFAWEDFFAYRSFELGRPLLGMRVYDLLQTARLVRSEYRAVYAVGVEAAGLVALHAAAIDPSIAGVAAVRTLASYQDIFEHPIYSEPVSSFVPGALAVYDLPALARSIHPRPCVLDAIGAAQILKGLGLS
jgi:cephalosporin-C deacetylase-like acetyl esterase